MKGNVVDICKVFDGSHRKLVIPVYQRNYDWTTKQCSRLFDDIVDMIRLGRRKHFFGAVVGNPEDSFTWVVIDGQQRLTTVSLFMLALAHAIRDGDIPEVGEGQTPSGLAEKLADDYLLLKSSGEMKFKLKPVKDDANAYQRLFASDDHFNEQSKITVNYRYFRRRLKEIDIPAQQLWDKGICQLEVMLLDLEAHDDPQRIFESLNSTGLALKESDKIRNLVLMGLNHAEQNRVYEQFWNPLEINVDFETDRFIRWYLIAKTNRTPKESAVFEEFKLFAQKSPLPFQELVEEMHTFSVYDKQLATAETGYPVVDKILRRANLVLGDVVKPFLYLTFRDLKAGKIGPEDFAGVIELIESYIFRRFISGLQTGGLNKIFANAYSDLQKLRKHDESYTEILGYMLTTRTKTGRFPDDEEFADAFGTTDIYGIRRNRPYLFHCLETAGSKDVKDIADYLVNEELTIEHIMPQTLTKAWRDALGEGYESIHSRWVHRIGNLTITGYNSNYSNLSFDQKLQMDNGFKDSPYWLNNYVKEQTAWGLEQLQARTEILTQRALEIWRKPNPTFVPEKEVLGFEPMGVDTSFTGKQIAAVEIEGTKQPVNTWVDAFIFVLRNLLVIDRDRLLAAAQSESRLETENVAQTVAQDSGFREVDPALAAHVACSTGDKVAVLRRLCTAIGYDPEEILFYLRTKEGQRSGGTDEAAVEPRKFADLCALGPLCAEVEGSGLDESETNELQDMFLSVMSQYAIDQPNRILGDVVLEQFLLNNPIEQLSEDQLLACLSIYVVTSRIMGRSVIHTGIVQGDIRRLIKSLASTVNTAL